ncbi:carboxylate--amine ligase [Sorangium sp. So ce1078]|uniref:carboxylate--amine ligase n=1 Tax=Sorangium sp. So ce1078 TaxID=3133329 RepID=UPI003F5DA9BD
MIPADIDVTRFSPERPPALVLGDITLVRPHGMAGIPVIVATTDPCDEVLCSRHVSAACIVPGFEEANRGASAAILLRLGERLHAALGRRIPLLYGTDPQLELVYRHRRALAQHFLLLLNDEDVCWSLLDKEGFYGLCEARGVLAPRTLRPGGDLASLREPILVKPRRKSAWAEIQHELLGGAGKARLFSTRAELLAHPHFERLRQDLIVQEHIPCGVVDLVSFHGFADERGELLAWFCGRKLRTYPAFAGESAVVEVTGDEAVAAAGREVAGKLGLKGPFKIDLVRDARSGALYTLEVNARYTLWNHVGAAAGVNLPRVAYDYLVLGRRPAAPPRAAPGHRWLSVYRVYRAFREQRGGASVGDWIGSVAGARTLYDAFAWDDPRPFARWASSFLTRKVARHALRDHRGRSR